jgi:hypothetical protein
MTPELTYKLERCGELLAQSPLDDEIKKTILENIHELTEAHIDQLLASLERETFELVALAEQFKKFDDGQDSRWEELAKRQERIAERVLEETLQTAGVQ